jgi:hypothetical protein
VSGALAVLLDMPPQPASRAAARIEALSNFMQFLLQLKNRENKAGGCATRQFMPGSRQIAVGKGREFQQNITR